MKTITVLVVDQTEYCMCDLSHMMYNDVHAHA